MISLGPSLYQTIVTSIVFCNHAGAGLVPYLAPDVLDFGLDFFPVQLSVAVPCQPIDFAHDPGVFLCVLFCAAVMASFPDNHNYEVM